MKRFLVGIVSFLLLGMSCSEQPADSSKTSGSAAGPQQKVILTVRPDEGESETIEREVTEVECGQIWTRAELGEKDFVSVRANSMLSMPAVDISVRLEMLELGFPYQDTILTEEDDFQLDDDGSFSGTYGFRLYGDRATDYELELDISCG